MLRRAPLHPQTQLRLPLLEAWQGLVRNRTQPWSQVSTDAMSALDFSILLLLTKRFGPKLRNGKKNFGLLLRAKPCRSFLSTSGPTKTLSALTAWEFCTPSWQAKIFAPKLFPPSSGTNPPINRSLPFLAATYFPHNLLRVNRALLFTYF